MNNLGGGDTPVNKAILEAFDGDIEDLMTWSSPQVGKKGYPVDEKVDNWVSDEEPKDDGIERQMTADGREVEWFNVRAEEQLTYEDPVSKEETVAVDITSPLTAQMNNSVIQGGMNSQQNAQQPMYTGELGVISITGNGSQIHPIDVNDPHYENYKADPYYEYGIGPEPKRPLRGEAGNGISGMAIASMSLGIGSLLFMFCGSGIPMAIAAIVLGIITVSRKNMSTGSRVMGIAGISTAALSMLATLAFWLFAIFG